MTSFTGQSLWHQMSDFNAKMHQIRFRLGSAQNPAGRAYRASTDLLAGFRGPTSKGRGQWREGEGREGERGEEGKEGGRQLSGPPMQISGYATEAY